MKVNSNISVFILAGGKSSRMGTEKGLVQVHNKRFIDYLIDISKKLNLPIHIISNTDLYNHLGYPVFSDLIKNKGPLAGIYTALHYSHTEYNLILSCDIPFVKGELISYLMQSLTKPHDCVIPMQHGASEPLCGIYAKKSVSEIKKLLDADQLSVRKALNHLNTHYIEIAEMPFYEEKILMNFNSPAEIKAVEKQLIV